MSNERGGKRGAMLDEELGNVGAPNTLVRFPRAMKRGAKVRRGPCARILPFPAQLSDEELDGRYRWIRSNADEWKNEETEGVEIVSAHRRLIADAIREGAGYPVLTNAVRRRVIAEGCERIEKRNRVKVWLESLGADLDEITTPEQALLFAFDRMQARDLPTIA